jgi:predicted nucleotide-binding protein
VSTATSSRSPSFTYAARRDPLDARTLEAIAIGVTTRPVRITLTETNDDEGHLAGKVEEKRYRARQNVILDLGMVLAKLGRRRVAVITKESAERPSDIAGLVYIPYRERVDEVKASLFRELNAAGYSPRTDVP